MNWKDILKGMSVAILFWGGMIAFCLLVCTIVPLISKLLGLEV